MLRGVSQSLYWGWGISTLKKRLLISDEKLSLSTYLIQKLLFWAYLIKKCRSVFQASFKSILGLSHAFFWDQICGLSAKRKNKDKQDLYIFRHSALFLLLRCHCCSSRVSSSRQASAKAGSHRSIPFLPTWKKKAVQIWMQGRDGKDRAELEHWNSLWNGQVIGDFISQLPNGHALPHDTMHYM